MNSMIEFHEYRNLKYRGTSSKDILAELIRLLREERRVTTETQKLLNKVGLMQEAREQLDAAHLLMQARPQILGAVR
jgi:hypothetical protein